MDITVGRKGSIPFMSTNQQKKHTMKTLAKFTTSKGNEIEIYTTSIIGSRGCVVFDKSCQL